MRLNFRCRILQRGQNERRPKQMPGLGNKRLDAWEKCGFYSAEVKHGGPDPNVAYKPTKRSHWGGQKEKVVLEPEENQRKRRDADCEWDGTFFTFSFHLIFLSKI